MYRQILGTQGPQDQESLLGAHAYTFEMHASPQEQDHEL